MAALQRIINEPSPCWTLFLIALTCAIGSTIMANRDQLRAWGYRIATAFGLFHAIYAISIMSPTSAEDLVIIVVKSLCFGSLILGLSWMTLGCVAVVKEVLVNPPLSRFRDTLAEHRFRRIRQVEAEAERMRQAADAVKHRRSLESAASQQADQRRRIDARAKAELTYSLFAPKLDGRFEQNQMNEYLRTYMRDDQPPEDVERRGEELVRTLQQHLESVEPPSQKRSLEDLAMWFAEQQERINALPLDDKIKRIHLAELNGRYAELSRQLLEDLKP